MHDSEFERIGEVDRSEHITRQYFLRGDSLEIREVDIHVPSWSPTGDHGHSLRRLVNTWRPVLERHGVLIGAFDGETLVGIALFRPELEPGMANLALLYVSRSHRSQGVGKQLSEEVIRLARAAGASRLYVSSTPTVATVEFYRGLGFRLAAEPNAEMFRAEPADIHMILEL
jgi:predicted N-acetyltransferase YhbS